MNIVCKLAVVTALGMSSLSASAGVIDSNSVLLDDAGASQLEAWLGQGDLDWNSLWYGTEGATSTSWHAAVDNAGPTVSVYRATNYLGESVLVGGFTNANWGANGWQVDNTAFLFNLTTGEYQSHANDGSNVILSSARYFATFGGGFGGGYDLFSGFDTLGASDYTRSNSFDSSQGRIDIAGDTGTGLGSTGASNTSFNVQALETFTFAVSTSDTNDSLGNSQNATSVPLPASGILLTAGLGLLGIGRKQVAVIAKSKAANKKDCSL